MVWIFSYFNKKVRTSKKKINITIINVHMEVYMQHINIDGFTLVELMVTILVIAIIAVITMPSFSVTYNRKKLESSVNELVIQISQARSRAVLIRKTTGVCLDVLSIRDCSTAVSINETNQDRIFKVNLDHEVIAETLSAKSIQFRSNGSIATSVNFILSRQALSYCINVGITGDTVINEGACL